MKKHVFRFTTIGLALLLSISLNALSTKACDWYVKREKGELPKVMPEAASFFSNYSAFFMGDPNEKVLYLTFDAGFDNGYHHPILDTLKAEGVKAAFFVDGNFVRRNPDLCRRIVSEGHLLCNHTLKHPDMTRFTSFEDYAFQIKEWERLVEETTGQKASPYYRPPMGRFSEQTLDYDRRLGIKTIFWSVAYGDWDRNNQPSHELAMEKLTSRIHPGAVILLHSTSKTNSEILGRLLRQMKSEGYRFGTLDELTSSR